MSQTFSKAHIVKVKGKILKSWISNNYVLTDHIPEHLDTDISTVIHDVTDSHRLRQIGKKVIDLQDRLIISHLYVRQYSPPNHYYITND